MPKTSLGIGIIGAGFGASVQLPGFLGLPEARVIGIASKDGKKTEELSKKFNLPKKFSSPDELIACGEIDLVSVAVPPFAQQELILKAIKAGKSILCEKPFTLSSEIAEHLYKEARAAGIVHAVDFEFRELPALKLIKKRLEDGTVGEIKNAKIIWLVGFWADPERPWRWQCDRDAGGGVLGALGVHLFDMVEWFFGPVKKLRAEMDISIKNRTDVSGTLREVTAEDHADIELVCENGISVKMLLSNAERSGAGLSMDIQGHRNSIFLRSTSQEYGRGLQVMEGGNEKESRLLQTAEDIPVQVDSRVPPFHALAGRLVHAILKKHISFHPSFFEGMRAQMIREAALQSSSAGGWVEIAERVP